MVHVYREIDSPDSFERWLRLLSKHGVDGSVIHKMRQNDVIDKVEGEEGYASEGEDWVEVDSAWPEGVAESAGEDRVVIAESEANNSVNLAIPNPPPKTSSILLKKMKKLFKKSVKSQPEASIDKCNNFILYEKHLSALTEVLVECSHKWREIAIFLNLPQYIIENISHKNMSGILSLNKVLLAWLKREISYSKPPTLESLEEALRSRTVGLGTEANSLRENFLEQCSQNTDIVHGPVSIRGKERKMHKAGKVSKDKKEFEIVSQTRDTEVYDAKSVLFEVRMHVSGCADVSLEYQWYKYEENVVSEKGCMLCIPCVDITAEGSYTCVISAYHGKKKEEIFAWPIRSDPIKLSVITPLDQYRSILIDRYTEQPEIPEDTWPPVSHSTFINLAHKQEGINKGSSS